MRIIKLKGKKCSLALRSVEDAERNSKWLSDEEITALYGAGEKITTPDKQRKSIQAFLDSGSSVFAIVTEKGVHIGNCEIWDVSQIHKTATIGLYIGEKQYWHEGYGTEAIMLMLKYCFEILNLNNIGLTVFSYNSNAIKCYKKIGFKEYGRRREAIFYRGEYHDLILMEYLAKEYFE